MINCTFAGRTVWVGNPEVANTKNGDVNRILFRIAVNRYTGKVNPDGTKVQETDFVLCSALGQAADFIIKNCSAKKPDGKVYSRMLLVNGIFRSYKVEKLFKVSPAINGQQINMDITVPDYEQWQMQVNTVEALDKRPDTTEGVSAKVSDPVQAQQQATTGDMPAPQGYTQYNMPYAPEQQQPQNFPMNPPQQNVPSQTYQNQVQPQPQGQNVSTTATATQQQAPVQAQQQQPQTQKQQTFTYIPAGIPDSPIKVPEGYSGTSTPF